MRERLLTLSDVAEWQTLLPARASVFASVEYASIYQQHSGYDARLFLVESDEAAVAYAFFQRPVHSLPFASTLAERYWDTLTPEYTGPTALSAGEAVSDLRFRERFSTFCRENRIVAEFAHLHPWNWSVELLETEGVEVNREIVYVDLTLSEEQLWQNSLTYACRKNIKRSQRENIRVIEATSPGDIREFHRIYIQTMERNQALTQYYFSLEYFLAFFERMPQHARFVLAIYHDQVVAGTLYLHDDIDVYSYLGGADHAFQNARPTNAVVYDTILWARRNGKKRLILGGSYEPDDGIFRYKASFSPLRARFHTYKKIHLPQIYNSLCRAWSEHYGLSSVDTYFPTYRATPRPVTESAESEDTD